MNDDSSDDYGDRIYNDTLGETIELGNRIAEKEPDADIWDIADGLLAGAIQYWLYARHPCERSGCEACEPVNTSRKRLEELLRITREIATESDYFHAPTDIDVGWA